VNGTAAVLLALTLAVAVVDWIAVQLGRRPVEYVAKPLTMVVLIATALALDVGDDGTARAFIVAGLVLSLAGDVFLMLPDRERWFVFGLGAFLLGHLAYVPGLWLLGISVPWLVAGLVLVLVGVATVGRRIVRGVGEREPRLVAPVTAYIAVISAMVVSAVGTASAFAIAGALLFYVSDSLIAVTNFIQDHPMGRLAVMVTYHLAQVGLVLALV
jgi:uncharacterized membrane protein YhhN